MRLSDLQTGKKATIVKVMGYGAFRKRIIEMGFVKGKEVFVQLNAPLNDPIKYKIMDYEVSLRRSEASLIEVMSTEESAHAPDQVTKFSIISEPCETIANHVSPHKIINIALVGNPNCGKTSLFNVASGSHEHVGNYGGVTVDAKKGHFTHKGYRFNIVDLPGTYSLSAYTPEEIYVRRHIENDTPDIIVNVVDASNLERNLYLTTELIDMDMSMVIALNMYDELEQSGNRLEYTKLGAMIGVPIVPTVSKSGRGVNNLFDTLIQVYEGQESTVRHIHINHGNVLEEAISLLKKGIKNDTLVDKRFSPRYLAIKFLEKDHEVERILSVNPNYKVWKNLRDKELVKIDKIIGEDPETAITNEKYGFISGALKETFIPGDKEEAQTTRIIDSFVTNKLFGFPIFIFIMWLMFETTFKLGAYPMQWIEAAVSWLSQIVDSLMATGPLKDLIIDGIIGGVGGVIVFLPNILILYLFISFMEDSGYMSRAAFIMDRIMHRIGLHGKSFIPLIMGFGCNVPAIMACRSIESRSSRIITMIINPFMSCSARLPIYILLIGTFFPNHSSLVFIGLYLLGILLAVITAKLLRRFFFKEDETPFVMELPPYRMPTAKATIRHMWGKAEQYIRKMGGLILVASLVVWFLSYFPRNIENRPIEQQQKESYLGQIGQWIEPVVEPLGLNWKAGIALLSGTTAKEIIVSTLGVLYAENEVEVDSNTLSQRLTATNPETGNPDFTPSAALAFMIFVLLYFPCLATLSAIVHESGTWKWALFSVAYNTTLAWILAFAVYQIARLF